MFVETIQKKISKSKNSNTKKITKKVCCNPGGKQTACWENAKLYQKCCFDTSEGRAFHDLRKDFMDAMTKAGLGIFNFF